MRRHWAFGVLAGAGVALRVAATVAYRPALVYIDSIRYLGGDERGLDPLGYSFLLLDPLRAAHAGLTGVAITQHVLGLAMGVCLYALLIRHGAPRWLALIAAAPVLLDAYQVQAEQEIMPDVLFEALLVAAIMLLLWPTAVSHRMISPRVARPGISHPGIARLGLAAALLGASGTVRQVGELLLIPLLAYVLLSRGPDWRARLTRAVATVAVFALPVAGYMALSAAVLGTGFRLSDMDDSYLYARVAQAANCATLRVPAYERPLCPAKAAKALGVDALATDVDSPLYRYTAPPGISRGAAISGFDRAVLTQQPLSVAADIADDAVKVFALTRDTAPGDLPVSRWQFQTTYPVFQSADRAVLGASRPRVVTPLAAALRTYQLHGGFTPGPLLLLFLIIGMFPALSARSPRSLRLACLLTTGLAVTALLGADLYEFSWRYQLPALVTLPLAGTLGAATMVRCPLNKLTRMIPRSGRSPAASSTPIPGCGSARMTSSVSTAPAEPTPSSSEKTSP